MARVIEVQHRSGGAARGGFVAPRLGLVDVARGAALVAMIVYHLVWDLDYFGLIANGVAASAPVRGLSHAIASAFLLIAGVSVALAHRGKFNGKKFRKQFIKVTLAAAAVTLVTAYVMPQAPITFGILHAMAVGVLLTAALAKAPWFVTALIAAAMIAAPLLFASPAFNDPLVLWLGLGTVEPAALDWRPVLPWTGVMAAGLAFARVTAVQSFLVRSADFDANADPISRGLDWVGRRTLPIYLIHQPVLFGLLYVVTMLTGATPQFGETHGFVESCRIECQAKSAATADRTQVCARACDCVVDTLKRKGDWTKVVRTQDGAEAAADAAARECAAR